MRHILAEVEFEDRPIRHAYLTCPECCRKFEITDCLEHDSLRGRRFSYFESSIRWSTYYCPICGATFGCDEGDELDIKEVMYPNCAKGVYEKKEVWEMKK